MNAKTPKPGIQRRAEQRKAVPYTVVDIGDKAALAIWKSEQVTKEAAFQMQRQTTRDRAVSAFNSAGGHHSDWLQSKAADAIRALRSPVYTPPKPWYSRAASAVSAWISGIWRNANFQS